MRNTLQIMVNVLKRTNYYQSCMRKPRGDHSTTWQKGMKSVTKGLGSVGASRLPGWGPRGPPNVWRQTLQVSGVCAVSFYPVRLIECLEV